MHRRGIQDGRRIGGTGSQKVSLSRGQEWQTVTITIKIRFCLLKITRAINFASPGEEGTSRWRAWNGVRSTGFVICRLLLAYFRAFCEVFFRFIIGNASSSDEPPSISGDDWITVT